jgi:hypothetical protein
VGASDRRDRCFCEPRATRNGWSLRGVSSQSAESRRPRAPAETSETRDPGRAERSRCSHLEAGARSSGPQPRPRIRRADGVLDPLACGRLQKRDPRPTRLDRDDPTVARTVASRSAGLQRISYVEMMRSVSDTLTIVTSIIGGGLLGTLGGWVSSWRIAALTRRGRARLIHEDFYRLQSTVTRLFFQTKVEGAWGERSWLTTALADKGDQQDVVAHLKAREDFGDCAGALDWAEYLREGYGNGQAPDDRTLRTIYWRLDLGRRALKDIADLPYAAHHPERVVEPEARLRNSAERLVAAPPEDPVD